MKTISKRLLVTSGLFVALCGLTSFNPYSQINHMASTDQEESISLAQTTNIRKGETVKPAALQDKGLRAQLDAAQKKVGVETLTKPEPTTVQTNPTDEEQKGNPLQSNTMVGTPKTTRTEAGAICNGDCDAQNKKPLSKDVEELLSKLTPEQQAAYRSALNIDVSDEDSEDDICVDGDYMDRIKCLEVMKKQFKTKKHLGVRKTKEDKGLMLDAISDLIEEVTLDTDLTPREMSRLIKKLTRLASGDRELQEQVRVAQNYQEARRQQDIFATQIERSAQQISSLDMQISQLESNPMTSYKANVLKIQRYQILDGIKSQIRGFQQQYKSVLPQSRANESSLVSSLRQQMSSDYQSIISPIAPAITDTSLLSLDAPPTIAASVGTGVTGQTITNPGQNGSVFGPQSTTFNSQIQPIAQNGTNYNRLDPLMSGIDAQRLSTLNPAQQIQLRLSQGSAGVNFNNGIANNTTPAIGQPSLPQQGRFSNF